MDWQAVGAISAIVMGTGAGIYKLISGMVESLNKRFDAIDKRFDAIDKRFDTIDKRLDAIDVKIDVIHLDLLNFDNRISRIEGGLDASGWRHKNMQQHFQEK